MSEYKAVTPDGRGGVQAALARETLSSMAIGTKTDGLSSFQRIIERICTASSYGPPNRCLRAEFFTICNML